MRCKVIFCYFWQCLKGESPSNTRLRIFSTLRSAPQIRNLFFGKNNFSKGGRVLLTQGQCVWTAFCMIFSGIPHWTIFGLPKYACLTSYLAYIRHVSGAQIWLSWVSLKRSCKIQFRRIDLGSIGPPSQTLWPNLTLARFPRINYNVNLQSGLNPFTGL